MGSFIINVLKMGILRSFWGCTAVLVIFLDLAKLRSVHKAFKAVNRKFGLIFILVVPIISQVRR